ncbi:MAG: type III secretion system translocon subunit SctE, partial [Planctomycetaceae bacterium]
MSNGITGSPNSNNIPSQNVAPPPADATTSSADSAQQTNATESSPALVVTTESTAMADTVFSSTSVGYQQHMSLEPASLPDMFNAQIAQQKLRNKMAEEMSKTTSALMDGMSQVASQMMDASKSIQNQQIDDIAEQSKKQKKRKIFGWIAKIATVVVSVALIATGVGAGIGAAMLAMTAVQLACKPFGGLDAALGKLFPDSKMAQVICKALVVTAVVATAVMTGGASLVSTGILVASNMY